MRGEEEDVFVIGGAGVYRQFLPIAERMRLTVVLNDFDGDTYFPQPEWSEWMVSDIEFHNADEFNHYDYAFVDLYRVTYQ